MAAQSKRLLGKRFSTRETEKKEKVKTNCQGLASQVTPSPLSYSEITCLQPKSSSWLCDSQLTNENCTPTTYFPSEARGRRKEGEEHWRGGIILGRLVETK